MYFVFYNIFILLMLKIKKTNLKKNILIYFQKKNYFKKHIALQLQASSQTIIFSSCAPNTCRDGQFKLIY
jgi:hypothetical protein